MPRIFRAIGDEFNQRFSRKDNVSVNELMASRLPGAWYFVTGAVDCGDSAANGCDARAPRRVKCIVTVIPG
jgi:hypothetical protein